MSNTAQPIAITLTVDAGEAVSASITVTRPDASVATPVVVDVSSGAGTGSFADTNADQPGTYTALLHIDGTAKYAAVDDTKTFTITPALLSRNLSWHIGNSA